MSYANSAPGFGTRLRRLLFLCGMSQAELARSIHYTESVVSRIITGKSEPKLQALVSIADCLGCTVDYLVGIPERNEENETD